MKSVGVEIEYLEGALVAAKVSKVYKRANMVEEYKQRRRIGKS